MSKTTKWIIGIVIAVIVIWGGYVIYKSVQKPVSTGPIKIGFIAPLSGDGESFGSTEKNATIMAIDEINKAGGIDDRLLEVVYEDGKCNGKDATSAIQKLINIDKIKIVLGGTCSAETLAMAPIAEANKVLLFSSFSSNPAVTNAGDYIFRNCPSDTDVAKVDADLISKLFKKVAILSENTDYSQGVRSVMKQIFQDKNISVVADEIFNGGTTDFRTTLMKIKNNANAEVLYVNPGTSAKTGGIIVKQARELGINIPIHGNFSLGTPDALQTGGKFMNGVIISDTATLTDKQQTLLAKYKELFKNSPANDLEVIAAYDRVYIIRDAIRAVGDNPTKIKNYLYQLNNFSGILGDYHFDQNGDIVGWGFFTNVIIQDGKKLPYTK